MRKKLTVTEMQEIVDNVRITPEVTQGVRFTEEEEKQLLQGLKLKALLEASGDFEKDFINAAQCYVFKHGINEFKRMFEYVTSRSAEDISVELARKDGIII